MCKTVYISCKRFDNKSELLRNSIKNELLKRGIDCRLGYSFDLFNYFRKHRTYGIAIAIDTVNLNGTGIVLNKQCSNVSREFAYNVSFGLDYTHSFIHWRGIDFVDSYNKTWFKFYNKVSAETKMIFNLCKNDKNEFERITSNIEKISNVFVDEIVRCLRSDCDYEKYRKSAAVAKNKTRKRL